MQDQINGTRRQPTDSSPATVPRLKSCAVPRALPPLPPGPSAEVEAINAALGAESAMTLQCKNLIHDYVKQILDAIRDTPIDQVSSGGQLPISLAATRGLAAGKAVIPGAG